MRVPHTNQSVLPRLIVFGHELLVSCLHQPLDILPADTEASKLIYDDCVNVLDIHETMHSPNPEDITIKREAEYLTHQLVFKLPTRVGGYLASKLFKLRFGVLV